MHGTFHGTTCGTRCKRSINTRQPRKNEIRHQNQTHHVEKHRRQRQSGKQGRTPRSMVGKESADRHAEIQEQRRRVQRLLQRQLAEKVDQTRLGHQVGQKLHPRSKRHGGKIPAQKNQRSHVQKEIQSHVRQKKKRHQKGKTILEATLREP